MADEPVVVSKVRPMKASNGVEEKTGMTRGLVPAAMASQKRTMDAKGGSFHENLSEDRRK